MLSIVLLMVCACVHTCKRENICHVCLYLGCFILWLLCTSNFYIYILYEGKSHTLHTLVCSFAKANYMSNFNVLKWSSFLYESVYIEIFLFRFSNNAYVFDAFWWKIPSLPMQSFVIFNSRLLYFCYKASCCCTYHTQTT